MKNIAVYISAIAFSFAAFSCEKDNYDPPNAILSGNLLYQSDTVYVERNAVHFQIYQYGFGAVGPVSTDETFAQDGSYSAALFNGDYKVTIPGGDGPFLWKQTATGAPDSLAVTMNGNQAVDIQVTPYYMIRNTQISASGTTVNASFSINKIITDVNAKDIENVTLFINKTQFVSGANNIGRTDVAGDDIIDPSNMMLSVAIPTITPTQNYVFARVGLKIVNVEDLVFSPLVKVTY